MNRLFTIGGGISGILFISLVGLAIKFLLYGILGFGPVIGNLPPPPPTVKDATVPTAYKVEHPAVEIGKPISIDLPAKTTWVHFPLDTPCANDQRNLNGPEGGKATCNPPAVIISPPYASQYPFYGDSNSTLQSSAAQSKCRTCCFMCQVAYKNPSVGPQGGTTDTEGSGTLPALEVIIDEDDSGKLYATYPKVGTKAILPVRGQTVKWFRSAPGAPQWSVSFIDRSPCESPATIGTAPSGSKKICVIVGNAFGHYPYTMTAAGGKSGSDALDFP